MNLRVPQNARSLFTGGGIVSRTGMTALHGINYFSPSPGRTWDVKALSVQIIKYRARSRGMEVRFRKCNISINKVICAWTWFQILNCTRFRSIHPVYVLLSCNLCVFKVGLTFLKVRFPTLMKICREGTSNWWIHTQSLCISVPWNTVKPAWNGPPIYRKPGQTENKFRNGVISHVK